MTITMLFAIVMGRFR